MPDFNTYPTLTDPATNDTLFVLDVSATPPTGGTVKQLPVTDLVYPFPGATAPAVSAVSFSSTVTLPSTANVLTLTLTGSCTINAPSSGVNGQSIQFRLTPSTNTVTWGTGWDWGTAGTPTLGTSGWNWIQMTYDGAASDWAAGLAGSGF
jgi:hypothetical protein